MLNVPWIIWLPTLSMIVLRLLGFVCLAPIFSHPAIPRKWMVVLAVAMALSVPARLNGSPWMPAGVSSFLLYGVGEFALGAVIGYTAQLIFMGVQLGACHIGQQMGLSLGEVFNPEWPGGGGVVEAAFGFFAMVVFLLIGGHRALIHSLLGSFTLLPPACGFSGGEFLNFIVVMLSAGFVLGLKVAAPILVAMLLATVAMGFLQKSVPQLNLLTTHLPVRVLLGLAVLAGSVGILWPLMDAAADYWVRQMQHFSVMGN